MGPPVSSVRRGRYSGGEAVADVGHLGQRRIEIGQCVSAGGATEAFERGAELTDVMALRYDRNRERRSGRVDLGI
ncbi:hypothetical protein [Nocardia alba]|uniref:Uncharacterized protein n=1 Tax=Nocardia alba TaxID=225051 RepID=A0A4R1FDH5_9NOCA|nr:hypothetical protein [Nocardia alba]TCJ89868.1 hypothetical protein DFR71_6157 [Nocardia alba]